MTTTHHPAVFAIRVRGHLTAQWAARFTEMTVTLTPDGDTIFTGVVADQAALYGLLRLVRDTGLELISVNQVNNDQSEPSQMEELTMQTTMKAVVYTEYGAPDVLRLQTVAVPTPKDNEVLVKVRATTVTTGDVNLRNFVFVPSGLRLISRLVFGFNKPKKTILGVEFAGDVVAVGQAVTRFKVGDAVFGLDGLRVGAYAEYKVIPESAGIVTKPAHLTYEEAAAFPNGALTALTFLKQIAKVQPGQTVLINGASGSVGSSAVQLAKAFGAEVTGVCSGRNADFVRSLGADHVIDYTREDFTRNGKTYDIIFDTVGRTRLAQCKASLTPNGLYLAVAGGLGEMLQALVTALFGRKKVKAGVSSERHEDLAYLKDLLEAGQIKPVVDRCYPLADMVEAHRYVDTGRKRGSVVITVA
ncbi:MAG: NAD(P)-dependent alcohol dehydrogenase [Anaerolineae bacterium]